MNTNDWFHNLKMAWATAVAAIGSGTATFLELIPTEIGKLASLAGIILTVTLIRLHWRNGNANYRKTLLETNLLRQQLEEHKSREAERLEAAANRAKEGRPLRREDD